MENESKRNVDITGIGVVVEIGVILVTKCDIIHLVRKIVLCNVFVVIVITELH